MLQLFCNPSIIATCINCSCCSIEPPANQVTLQELIQQYNLTDQQLNSEIEVTDTPTMALCFDDVSIYSTAMGLAPAEQADVKESRRLYDTQTAMMNCLQIWKRHNPSRATYKALLDIVLRLKKGDTADQICWKLTQREYMYDRVKEMGDDPRADVAHSEVDLSVFPEPLATDDTGFRFQHCMHCDLMVHYHMQEKTCYHWMK